MFTADSNDQVTSRTSQFYSNLMMCRLWCQPGNGMHSLRPATCNITDTAGNQVVFSYALARPDGFYSLLVLNTDSVAHSATVKFSDTTSHYFTGLTSRFWIDPSNYAWNSNGSNGTANPNGPIEAITSRTTSTTSYALPPHSMTVLRGRIQ